MFRLVSINKSIFSFNLKRFTSTIMGSLNEVIDVDIDPSGTFKYILIKAKDSKSNQEKYIVRGYGRCSYHADIFDVTQRKTPKTIDLECVGGGRIKHEPDAGKLNVYGYSQVCVFDGFF
jgi:phosphohistidine phosphatase